jgi:hypothetical protein
MVIRVPASIVHIDELVRDPAIRLVELVQLCLQALS